MRLLFILFAFSSTLYGQDLAFQWANQIGNLENEEGQSVAVDEMGNVYLTGGFRGTVDFDPGDGLFELTSTTPDFPDIYLVKLNSDGEFLWAQSYGADEADIGTDLTIDPFGNVYLTGIFKLTVDFDYSGDVFELSTTFERNAFVLKLDGEGNFIWANSIDAGGENRVRSIVTDAAGNFYMTGFYTFTADFDPGDTDFELSAEEGEDVFVLKWTADGDFIWAQSVGGSEDEEVESIAVDPAGNVTIGGKFEGTVDFDPGAGLFELTSNGFFDAYLLKLNPDGDFIWAIQNGGTSQDEATAVAIEADGTVYLGGSFRSTVDFDPGVGVASLTADGTESIYIQKLSSDGDFIWVQEIAGTDLCSMEALVQTADGVVFSGTYLETVDFDPGPGVTTYTSEGLVDSYIAKLNLEGDLVWVQSFGGAANVAVNCMALDTEGNPHLIGEFSGTADFDPGEETASFESSGFRDVFVSKLTECLPTFSSQEVTACISYTWINGETYFESTTDEYVLINEAGCDSVTTLDLTINEVDISTTTEGATITSNATGVTYQWLDCDDGFLEIDGAIEASFTAVEDGSYAVEVTTLECVDTSDCIPIEGVGIAEDALSQITIYPNPSSGLLNVDLGEMENVAIRVFSVRGDVVYQTVGVSSPVYSFELNVEAGVYVVEVLADDGRGQFRLVVK